MCGASRFPAITILRDHPESAHLRIATARLFRADYVDNIIREHHRRSYDEEPTTTTTTAAMAGSRREPSTVSETERKNKRHSYVLRIQTQRKQSERRSLTNRYRERDTTP